MTSLHKFSLSALALAALSTVVSAAVDKYEIDPVHSSVGFSLRHFVSKVPGSFTQTTGTIAIDPENIEKSSVEAEVSVKSVSTANDKRDEHLRSPDFFDAAKFPTATFKSTKWEKDGDKEYKITGDLTIRGITKPVVLEAELLGFGEGPKGAKLVGFEAETEIKKTDFGFSSGGAALGDDVKIKINIEARKK